MYGYDTLTVNFDGAVDRTQWIFRNAMVRAEVFFFHPVDGESHFRFVRGLFKRRVVIVPWHNRKNNKTRLALRIEQCKTHCERQSNAGV